MKTTSYICDCCKKSVAENDLVNISMSLKGLYFSANGYRPATSASFDICKPCLKAKGFVIDRPEDGEFEVANKKNENTLENNLIVMLENLGVAFVE